MKPIFSGIVAIVGLLFVVAAIGFIQAGSTIVVVPGQQPTSVMCTMETRQCPDGSYVGRSGPNCEFAACPRSTTTPVPTTTVQPGARIVLNQKTAVGTVSITALQLVEDSRCPVDVQCIQAGTVRVLTQLESAGAVSVVTFKLGEPVSFAGKQIELVDVLPIRNAGTVVSSADYRFVFTVHE